jgi:hypothetical protein
LRKLRQCVRIGIGLRERHLQRQLYSRFRAVRPRRRSRLLRQPSWRPGKLRNLRRRLRFGDQLYRWRLLDGRCAVSAEPDAMPTSGRPGGLLRSSKRCCELWHVRARLHPSDTTVCAGQLQCLLPARAFSLRRRLRGPHARWQLRGLRCFVRVQRLLLRHLPLRRGILTVRTTGCTRVHRARHRRQQLWSLRSNLRGL